MMEFFSGLASLEAAAIGVGAVLIIVIVSAFFLALITVCAEIAVGK